MSSSSLSGTCSEALISIKLTYVSSSSVRTPVPEFFQDPYLETLHLSPPSLPSPLHISFMISLLGSVVNPVKTCTTSGHSFLWQEFYCFGLDGFFYNNNGIFNGVILPDFHHAVYIRVLFHCADNPFHQVPCVMSLKDS